MSCQAAGMDMQGGRRRTRRRKGQYVERIGTAALGTALVGAPILGVSGGRKKTRRGRWRYIRGMKIRFPARKVKNVGVFGKKTAKSKK